MRRCAVHLLAALAAFGLTAGLLGRLAPYPPMGDLDDKLRFFEAHRDEYDVLFFGSSRVFRGVVPGCSTERWTASVFRYARSTSLSTAWAPTRRRRWCAGCSASGPGACAGWWSSSTAGALSCGPRTGSRRGRCSGTTGRRPCRCCAPWSGQNHPGAGAWSSRWPTSSTGRRTAPVRDAAATWFAKVAPSWVVTAAPSEQPSSSWPAREASSRSARRPTAPRARIRSDAGSCSFAGVPAGGRPAAGGEPGGDRA